MYIKEFCFICEEGERDKEEKGKGKLIKQTK